MPVTCQEGSAWSRETGPCSLSSLIQDLSLSDAKGSQTTAPPSKRQCRSLSLSEELNSCRTIWRPIGSRIWTPVEKRRCHSGGSVQRCSNGFSGITMQRSSSFSLPARSNTFPGTFPRVCDQVCIPQDFGSQTFHGFQESSTITGSGAEREEVEPLRSLSLSHEQISTSDYQSPSARSTPDSTPELERRVRSGGLSRSRSQPCVLNDKKIGMKRRRPEEVLEQRPSLDLAKMTQNLGSFPNITGHNCSQLLATNGTTRQSDLDTAFSSDTGHKVALPQSCENGKEEDSKQELQYSPADGGTYEQAISHMDEVESWDSQKNVFQLGGELDIEQIERN